MQTVSLSRTSVPFSSLPHRSGCTGFSKGTANREVLQGASTPCVSSGGRGVNLSGPALCQDGPGVAGAQRHHLPLPLHLPMPHGSTDRHTARGGLQPSFWSPYICPPSSQQGPLYQTMARACLRSVPCICCSSPIHNKVSASVLFMRETRIIWKPCYIHFFLLTKQHQAEPLLTQPQAPTGLVCNLQA